MMDLEELARLIRERDQIPKLFVFASHTEMQATLRKLPASMSPYGYPAIIVDPELTNSGSVMSISDKDVAQALIYRHNHRSEETAEEPKIEDGNSK